MNDYEKYIGEIGLTEDQVQILVNLDNVIELNNSNYYKGKSNIHGIGVFASKDIKKGDIIGNVTINNKYRTTLGRWVNHHNIKNTIFYKIKNDLIAIAEEDINKNQEILIDYRDHTLSDPNFLKNINEFKKLILT
jgi:SET domain-containing protein